MSQSDVAEAVDWETAEITLTPDPCWTPGMEAIAQSWLDLIRKLALWLSRMISLTPCALSAPGIR